MKPIIAEEKTYPHDADRPQPPHKPPAAGRVPGVIAAIITICWTLHLLRFFGPNGSSLDSIGGYIALSIVKPHLACVLVASALSMVGIFGRKRWAMLTCGILMIVSGALVTSYISVVVLPAILFFFSYGMMLP